VRSAFATLLALLVLVAGPLAAAGQAGKTWRIGVLLTTSPTFVAALRDGFRELGYVEGKDLTIELRAAAGRAERLRELAEELVSLKVDVMVTGGTQATEAARDASRTIPIVMAMSGDAVGTGLVASLARPGGNITGITASTPELAGKRVELLREAVPRLASLAVLWNAADPPRQLDVAATRTATDRPGVKLHSIEVRRAEDFDDAFAGVSRARPDALLALHDPLVNTHRRRVIDFVARRRLPTMHGIKPYVDAGGLMSYAPSFAAGFHRSAAFVDKILKGAKPADLPVEQPTRFELVINARTAKTLGLTLPPSLLLRADSLIE
jgi:putative ABC transport system substrate-binding protein